MSVMAEVCSTCGLPKDICVCGEIEKEQQRIRIRLETRKFGRPSTIIDGIDDKNANLPSIAQKLKSYCACGGTSKNGLVMLQGCLLYTSPSPRDGLLSRMPSSA